MDLAPRYCVARVVVTQQMFVSLLQIQIDLPLPGAPAAGLSCMSLPQTNRWCAEAEQRGEHIIQYCLLLGRKMSKLWA